MENENENAGKKPKKYPGLKKQPYAHLRNHLQSKETGKKKRKKRVGIGSITKKKGLSPYQLRTQEEFLKVRPGESKEAWLHRTRFRRVRTEEELATTKAGKRKLYLLQTKKKNSYKNKIVIRNIEKDFNFLKYYVFIINWASIHYNIPQTDLELAFHFYENVPFSKDEFVNKCLLVNNLKGNTFNRFKNEGYIIEFRTKQGGMDDAVCNNLYKLSRKFINVLTAIYEKIAFQHHFDYKATFQKIIPKELEGMLIEMANENYEIVKGTKKPSQISLIKKTHYDTQT